MELVFKAVGLGLFLSVFIGPIFFLLIEASSRSGLKSGIAVSLGAILNDILYISLIYYLLDAFLDLGVSEKVLKLVGGIVLAIIGMVYFFMNASKRPENSTNISNYFLKSFLINAVNPSVLFFWLGAVSYSTSQFEPYQMFGFFSLALLTTFTLDVLKIYFSFNLSKIVGSEFILKINKLTGSVLFFLGISLVIKNF